MTFKSAQFLENAKANIQRKSPDIGWELFFSKIMCGSRELLQKQTVCVQPHDRRERERERERERDFYDNKLIIINLFKVLISHRVQWTVQKC